jgi:hypothetical protein
MTKDDNNELLVLGKDQDSAAAFGVPTSWCSNIKPLGTTNDIERNDQDLLVHVDRHELTDTKKKKIRDNEYIFQQVIDNVLLSAMASFNSHFNKIKNVFSSYLLLFFISLLLNIRCYMIFCLCNHN